MRVNRSKKKKVLMLASVASMIDQFNMANIRQLLCMGYEVHVACNFKEGNTCDRQRIRVLQKTLQDMRAVWHQWDCPRNINSVRKCCRAYRQLWRLTGCHHYEWLHCHSPVGGALARLVAHRRNIRIVYTAHGFHFYQGAPWKNWMLYYPAEAFFAHWTDVLITVNKEDYLFAEKRLRAGKICYIPGVGIDTEKFAGAETEYGRKEFCRKYQIPEDALVLLSVGELNQGKNHRIVIEALAALQRIDVYYLICGQGALRKELKSYADRLGAGRYLRMPGYQQDMSRIYRNADIFVFPSMREGMPAALMEAMAAGLPCIASNIRGNRELICGRELFSLKHPEQLLAVLKQLLDDEHLRQICGSYNQKKISSYDIKAVEKRMQRIYQYMAAGIRMDDPRLQDKVSCWGGFTQKGYGDEDAGDFDSDGNLQ